MNSLSKEPIIQTNHIVETNTAILRLRPKKGQIMKTPCNHKFHVKCLVGWMSIKVECPTCRASLPILDFLN